MSSRGPARQGRFGRGAGFTLAELVTVLIIVGIVSVYAASRFSGSFAKTRAVYDQLFAQLQHARRLAVAQRRVVCVHLSGTQSRLFYGAAQGTPTTCPGIAGVVSPTGQTPFTVDAAAAGAGIAPAATFQFDALGRYLTGASGDPGANLTVTVSGEGSYGLTVERESGYVHP